MFYEPVQSERFFERDLLYSHIDWMAFPDAVDAFALRMQGWYIRPIELLRRDSGHHAFAVMAMTCMLIDALSQYRLGKPSSDGRHFKQFVQDHLPAYAGHMPVRVWHYDQRFNPSGKELKDYADVLWNGFRCGILHQAHAPLYCGIVPGRTPPNVEATNHAKYGAGATNSASAAGTDCPVVVICPEHLFEQVMDFFADYLRDLKDHSSQHDQLRADFKTKFADSFGVDLANSVL